MTKFKTLVFSLSTLIFGLGLFPNYVLAQNDNDEVTHLISKMTLDQKVGQLFMIGFPQDQYDENLQALIDKVKPGSLLLFKRNIRSLKSVKKLNQKVSDRSLKISGIRPFLVVDQEGGVVTRVPSQPPIPSALALGQTNSAELALQYGKEVGHLIKDLGFNLNLAPVLDLSDPEKPSFIASRSLGDNPDKVGDLGYSISEGLLKAQVIPTAKHFPGLGSSTLDPHNTMASRATSLEDFLSKDIRAFQKFINLGPNSAVMLSHLSYPALDPSRVPALFSERIIKYLLRKRLGFTGLVITDDIMMEASSDYAKPEEAAVMALKAGADIIMVTWSSRSQKRSVARVKKAILNKELSLAEVHEKLHRILTAKLAVIPKDLPKSESRVLASTNFSNHRLKEIEQKILESNLHSQVHKLSAMKSNKDLCVFSSSRNFLRSFRDGAKSKMKYLFIAPTTTSAGFERSLKRNSCHRAVVTIQGQKTSKVLKNLNESTRSKLLVINLGSPRLLDEEASFKAVIHLYFPHVNAGQKIAQQLSKISF